MTRAHRPVLTLLALALASACHAPALPAAHSVQSPLAPPTIEPYGRPAGRPDIPAVRPDTPPTLEPYGQPPARPDTPTARPDTPVEGRTPQRLVIESIGMDQPLLAVGLKPGGIPVVPDHDAAWFEGSGRPSGGENVVLWGHALRFLSTPNLPAPMERMKEAAVGDIITLITTDGQTFRYQIQEQVWATPDQVGYILPKGRELLTIVNCIGDIVLVGGEVDMSHRLITVAVPMEG